MTKIEVSLRSVFIIERLILVEWEPANRDKDVPPWFLFIIIDSIP
ncbi:hypothetical protein D1AOALGA4SA_407 [Olavius algarvensis Delta 1 endosymbiont]|nr:hypothetical protein D1AOALGA4SA_407 [Olavius algarvensis Delta 1 endosymbiont]